MESKLLVGGKSIVDKTTEQDRALEQRRKELADQRVCIYKRKLYSQADRREKTYHIMGQFHFSFILCPEGHFWHIKCEDISVCRWR